MRGLCPAAYRADRRLRRAQRESLARGELMNWIDTIKTLAPTAAAAGGGPPAGVAVSAIGELFGISEPTQDKIKAAIENGSLTGEQISGLRQLEIKLKAEEAERGFRYAELEFKDRDSA